jgi:hypothetical protein
VTLLLFLFFIFIFIYGIVLDGSNSFHCAEMRSGSWVSGLEQYTQESGGCGSI